MGKRLGHLLGAAQAEADRLMLDKAFIETADYQALLHTTDFSYVVGRRGAGKSAIFQKLSEVFGSDTLTILLAEEPEDFEMLQLHGLLNRISSDYRILRAVSRLLWTVNFLLRSADAVVRHYRFNQSIHSFLLTDYLEAHRHVLKGRGAVNCATILRSVLNDSTLPEELPQKIATEYEIGKAGSALREALDATGLRVVTLYDRLDEAWIPDIGPVATLGGIAKMASDYREKHFPFYPVLFIRDNMFRALAQFDDDFTRHIEGHSLRLQWNEESLFHLVAARLRVALELKDIESPVKVWNRFAYRELHDREGFAKCLRYTLFRPRDILVLLNEAYLNALREGRDTIIEKDLETSATSISQHRLEDLCKEYDKVLPGLRLFISSFRGQPAQQNVRSIVDHLQHVADHSNYSDVADRDLVLFENGGEMFSALYSVGYSTPQKLDSCLR